MNNNDYLEKLLGEQYNMKNYFVDTYTEPQHLVNVIENVNPAVQTSAQVEANSLVENNDQNQNASTQPIAEKTEENIKIENLSQNLNDKNDLQVSNPNTVIYKEEAELQTEIPSSNIPAQQNTDVSNQASNTNQTQMQEIIEQDTTIDNAPRQYQAVQVNADLTKMYPNIYQAIDPIVELSVANMEGMEINEDVIESLASRIYNAIEPSAIPTNSSASNTIPVTGRPHNSLLHDLIKILILNKFAPMPPRPPHHNHRPPMPPPRPPMHEHNSMRVSNNINYQDVPYPEDMV